MPHIHTAQGQHDHTVSAFIVRVDTPQPSILLHKHKKLGIWLQFGGHIELDESPWRAISHELQEETGYENDQLLILQPKSRLKSLSGAVLHPLPICSNTHMFDKTHFHTDSGFVFVTNEEPRKKPGIGESEEFQLFSAPELKVLSNTEIFDNVREICLYILDNSFRELESLPFNSFKI